MDKNSLKIGKRAFITSFLVLLGLMVIAEVLTKVLPAGKFERVIESGREVIVPDTYKLIDTPDIPIYKFLTAPFEVLASPDSAIVIVIIVFLLLMAGSFALLQNSGVISYVMDKLIKRFYKRRYLLASVVSFTFMVFGATLGVFEEMIILVPFCIILARQFKWDSLVGLGISLLSVGVGFGTAILNPFTLGVAQKLAKLPLFSGFLFRILVFISFFALLQFFLQKYIRKIEKDKSYSLVAEDENNLDETKDLEYPTSAIKASKYFTSFLGLIVGLLISSYFSDSVSDIIFPLIGLTFAIGSIVSVSASKSMKLKDACTDFFQGTIGVLPAALLILMAMSIKLIMERGLVLDTLLFKMQNILVGLSPILAIFALYVFVLIINFFIGSGSAKAFLLLPLLLPLTDLMNINRQIAVQAFVFGDGTSNLLYPTNAALMVALGFSVVSYPKWIKWTYKLQIGMVLLSIFWLAIAYLIDLGPF